MGLPLIISVAIDEDAIALPQPNVLNFTSEMMPLSTLIYIRMMSPHLALPTSPMPSASGILPTLRGFSKWSMTFSLYSAIGKPPLYHFVLDQVRARTGLQLVPHRGDAAQIGDHLPDVVHDVCHFLVRVVFAHGQAQ